MADETSRLLGGSGGDAATRTGSSASVNVDEPNAPAAQSKDDQPGGGAGGPNGAPENGNGREAGRTVDGEEDEEKEEETEESGVVYYTHDEQDDVLTVDTQSCVNAQTERLRAMRRKKMLFSGNPESIWRQFEEREVVEGRKVRPVLSKKEHVAFSRAQIRRLCRTNESIEPRHAYNSIYYNYLATNRPRNLAWRRWFIFMLIGAVMGLVGLVMFQSIAAIADLRHDWLTDRVSAATRKKNDGESGAVDLAAAFLLWVGTGAGLVVVSTLLVWWQPQAGGSGVTDVMAYLNGVFFQKVFNIRTLAAKAVSCIAAVGSGLPVGPEGPMIHIGALLGAGLGSGRSKSLKFSMNMFFSSIRNPRDHMDWITAGAAAGVAVAFGAPIGGLLFVFEEVATHWRGALTPMIFAASLTACFVFGLFASQVEGWKLRHEASFGGLIDDATILFLAKADRYMYARDLLSSAAIGTVTGVLAVLFTKANLFIARLRLKAWKWYRRVEPLGVLLVYLTFTFIVPLCVQCDKLGSEVTEAPLDAGPADGAPADAPALFSSEGGNASFITAPCSNPGEYSPTATFMWNSGEKVIRLLFTKHMNVDLASLLFFIIPYYVFSCFSCGMMISSGIVIPMLLTGGGVGRLMGRFINAYIDDTQHEGVYAIIGAAGYFAGVSRLTVSLAVIMIELTSEKRCLLPIMVSVMVAKFIADRTGHSLYHGLLELRCVPFLEAGYEDVMHDKQYTCFKAGDICTTSVACLRERETVASLINTLRGCKHHGFPVVREEEGALRYLGMVTRAQLHILLCGLESTGSTEYGVVMSRDLRPEWEHLQKLAEENFIRGEKLPNCLRDDSDDEDDERVRKFIPPDTEVDLTIHADTSYVTVQPSMSITMVYRMFTTLGLRHLPVVSEFGLIAGIITRSDLLPCRMQKRMLRSLGVLSNAAGSATEVYEEEKEWEKVEWAEHRFL